MTDKFAFIQNRKIEDPFFSSHRQKLESQQAILVVIKYNLTDIKLEYAN